MITRSFCTVYKMHSVLYIYYLREDVLLLKEIQRQVTLDVS